MYLYGLSVTTFDVAYKYGLQMDLDGVFSCTAPIATKLEGAYVIAARHLDEILLLRNEFVKVGIFRGFNYGTSLLGYVVTPPRPADML